MDFESETDCVLNNLIGLTLVLTKTTLSLTEHNTQRPARCELFMQTHDHAKNALKER